MSKHDDKMVTEALRESHLPSDLFTSDLGSSYGIGEFPDLSYGMGVLDGVVNPEYHEAPAFPTGVQKGAADLMDLTSLAEDDPEPSLADLSWLDPTQLPDPDHVPESPHGNMIPELVEAWGVNRRTDGIHNTSHHAAPVDYVRATSGESSGPAKRASARTIESVVTHAMRRSIEGQDITRVVREAAESMGEEMARVVPLLRQVQADHGLAGNVFIRAAAYPGWGAGKGKDHAKRYASRARYIVVSPDEMEQATWIQNGRCAYTGKRAVTEVPWKAAYAHYAPRLQATGFKVASSADPREALRAAFLSQPEKKAADPGFLPTHVTPDQRISMADARKAFDAYKPAERKVYDPSSRDHAKRMARVEAQLDRLERDGLLPVGERQKILASGRDPMDMLRSAARVATQIKKGTYVGDDRGVEAQARLAQQELDRKSSSLEGLANRLASYSEDKVAGLVKRWIKSGAVTERRVRALVAKHKNIHRVVEALVPEVREAAVEFDSRRVSTKVASYSGSSPENAADVTHKLSVPAAPNKIVPRPVQAAARWVRRTMSEGFAGKDLDDLIQNRFAESVLRVAGEAISSVRKAHEGASGFLYVDAAAYASEAGVKGCEDGALKHRANQIPSVAAMPRCATCALARQLEDGTRKCGAYNKTLLDDPSGPEIERIKRANIKAAGMTDQELTASLFAPAYDPSEFDLQNDTLEGFAIEDDNTETDKLSSILFDGWRIE